MYALYYREQHGLLVTGEQLALDEINKLGKPRFGMLWNYIYIYVYICVYVCVHIRIRIRYIYIYIHMYVLGLCTHISSPRTWESISIGTT